jgi:hypothetical protein
MRLDDLCRFQFPVEAPQKEIPGKPQRSGVVLQTRFNDRLDDVSGIIASKGMRIQRLKDTFSRVTALTHVARSTIS